MNQTKPSKLQFSTEPRFPIDIHQHTRCLAHNWFRRLRGRLAFELGSPVQGAFPRLRSYRHLARIACCGTITVSLFALCPCLLPFELLSGGAEARLLRLFKSCVRPSRTRCYGLDNFTSNPSSMSDGSSPWRLRAGFFTEGFTVLMFMSISSSWSSLSTQVVSLKSIRSSSRWRVCQ